jgi:regulator of protease activity HflC (stomatin/prohibitin superfamily)
LDALVLDGVEVSYRVVDPAKALSQVADHRSGLTQLAAATVKKTLAGREKDALMFEQRGVEAQVKKEMNAVAGAWGINVEKVEMTR